MMLPERSILTSVCYVRLAVSDLAASARFAKDILGLQLVSASNSQICFRSDNRYRTLSFTGKGGSTGLGVEVWDEDDLEKLEQRLVHHGRPCRRASREECDERFVQSAVLTEDASGNSIELVARPAQSGRRYFPSRDAGVVQFQGVGLRSRDLKGDFEFWRLLGAEVTDWVGDITYLRIDGIHHRIALYPSRRNGILYMAFEVEGLDCIMQNSYFMQEHQVKIVQGPGRQPASNQIFLHIEGPDGHIFSYVYGIEGFAERPRSPRQFPLTAASLCLWGSESRDVPELSAGAR